MSGAGGSITFPQVYLMRGYMVCCGVELSSLNLDRVNLGLDPRPKWHHITFTKSRDGRPCFRVRVCKTCAGDRRVELGTFLDLESALLVNDAHEILCGRTRLLNVLKPEDIRYLKLLYVRKLDRGKALIYPLYLVLQQVGVELPSGENELPGQSEFQYQPQQIAMPPAAAAATTTMTTAMAVAAPAMVSLMNGNHSTAMVHAPPKRKRSANGEHTSSSGGGSSSSGSSSGGSRLYKPLATFEAETRVVLSRVLSTPEAGAVFEKHCNRNLVGYPAAEVLQSLLQWLQNPTQLVFNKDIHPLYVGISCKLLLTGKREVPPHMIAQMVDYLHNLLARNLKRRGRLHIALLSHDPDAPGETLQAATRRYYQEALAMLKMLPNSNFSKRGNVDQLLRSARVVLQEQYLDTYEMCLHLRMPTSVPVSMYQESELEKTLHSCEKQVRMLSRIAKTLTAIIAAEASGQGGLSQSSSSMGEREESMKAQLAECIAWYIVLHASTSLRLHEMQISSNTNYGLDALEDSLDFVKRILDDRRLNVAKYQPSHRIIILSATASIHLSKLRTLHAVATSSALVEGHHDEYIGIANAEPDIADTIAEIAKILEEVCVLAKSLGLLPLSNFAALCQLIEGGFPGATSMKSLFLFEGVLIFQAACLDMLYRIRDPSVVPVYVHERTDLNPASLIKSLHLVLARTKQMCSEAGFAFLLADSTRCLRSVVEILTTPWAAEVVASNEQLHPMHQHLLDPQYRSWYSSWADEPPCTPSHNSPSPYQCISQFAAHMPTLPVQIETASLAIELLGINAERYHFAALSLHHVGVPLDGYMNHASASRQDSGLDTSSTTSDTAGVDTDDASEHQPKKQCQSTPCDGRASWDSLDDFMLSLNEPVRMEYSESELWDRQRPPTDFLAFPVDEDDDLLQLALDEIIPPV